MSQTQQQLEAPRVLDAYEKDNKYYLKTFLLDDSVARNGMGVVPEYIPKHIHKFLGKPVILTPSFYHPHEFEHYNETGDADKDLSEYQRLQKPYAVGTIVDVSTNSNIQQGGNTNYSALLEVTDPKAIAAFRAGKVPLYVSPSIYRVHSKDPMHSITDYEALHLAIVDNPAYGFHKANIRAHCQGDKIECSRMLAQASNGLSYCVEKKLGELKNVLQGSNSSYSNLRPQDTSVNYIMAENQDAANAQSVQQEQPQVDPIGQKQEQVSKPASEIEQKIQEQKADLSKQTKTTIGTPVQTKVSAPEPQNINPPGSEEQREEPETGEEETPCAKAQASYESKLIELENKIKAFDEFKANYEKTSQETQLQNKRSRIETIVPTNYANSDEERSKAIESLMNVRDENLETILNSFVIPATRNIRQGGMRPRAKVTDFVKEDNTSNNKNVTQAGIRANARDIQNLERMLSFGSGSIVPNKRNDNKEGIA